MEQTNTYERFRFFFTMARLAGGPIYTSKEESKLFILYYVLTAFCGYMLTLGALLDIYYYFGVGNHIYEDAIVVPPGVMCVWMHIFLRFRKDAVLACMCLTEEFEWEDLPLQDPETGYSTMASILPRIKPFAKRFSILVVIYHSIYTAIRVGMMDGKPLPISGYFGFDHTITPIYQLLIVCQLLGSFMWLITYVGFSCMYAFLMAIACSQLEKLRFNIMKISSDAITSELDSESESVLDIEDNNTKKNCNVAWQQKLIDCIRHHQKILKYMRALEDTLNPYMTGQFLVNLLGMCGVAFAFVMSWGNVMSMSQSILAYGVLMAQLYVSCWFGQELTDQALCVGNAIWKCEWISTPISNQRNLIFMMTICQKKFSLTAGKFVLVQKETMENIFKQTISLLMFLMKMKDKHSEEN